MRFSPLPLLAALLCAPAYAAQADVPEAGVPPTEAALPAYPAAPGFAAPPLAPSTSAVAPAEAGLADGMLRLREPQVAPPARGWGVGAGTLGLSLAGLTLVSGLINQVTFASFFNLYFTFFSSVATGIVVPIVALGAYSSWSGAGIDGSLLARVTGWLAYGLSFVLPVFIAGRGGFSFIPITSAALSALAFACHGIDARLAGKQERQKLAARAGISVAPYLGPIASAEGRASASLGLAGRF